MKPWLMGCCLLLAAPFLAAAGDQAGSPDNPDLVILYTGNGNAEIEPMGCCFKTGGMARRANRIADLRKQHPHLLVVDSGDCLRRKPGDAVYDIRPKHVHRALAAIGYDVLNIAGGEMAAGEAFRKLFENDAAMPLVSTNVVSTNPDRKNLWPAFRLKKAGLVTIGIMGLTKQTEADGFRIAEPEEAVRRWLPAVQKEADIIVLLSHIGWEKTKEIVQNHPGIHVAIVGYDDYPTFDPETVNDTLIVKNAFDGGMLGIVEIWLNGERGAPRIQSRLDLLDYRIPVKREYTDLESNFRAEKKAFEAELKKRAAEQNKQRELARYLHMSPEQFMEYMKKNNGRLDQKVDNP
ncbi:MAG: hypothetical protein ACOZF0_04515 [Thermodesulfobacteriota bacterium]